MSEESTLKYEAHKLGQDDIFDLSPEAIIILNKKGDIVNVNNRSFEWLGYHPNELIGMNLREAPFLDTEAKLTAVRKYLKRMSGAEIKPYELDFQKRDGGKIIGLVQGAVIHDEEGNPQFDLLLISDITQRKEAENTLIEKTKQLEKTNRLMNHREEKMVELKNEIEILKQYKTNNSFFNFIIKVYQDIHKAIKSIIFSQLEKNITFSFFIGIKISLFIFLLLTTNLFIASIIFVFSIIISISTVLFYRSFFKSIGKEIRNEKAVLNLLEDLEEKQVLEENTNESIIKSIQDAILMVSSNHIISFVNDEFVELTGIPKDNLLGKNFFEELQLTDEKGNQLLFPDKIEKGEIDDDEQIKFIGQNEKNRVAVLTNPSPLFVNNKYHGFLMILHDQSESYKLQQQKDDFFSIASHELRTPLTVIAGNVDMILDGYGESKISDNDKQLLKDVATASERLIGLVNEFLNISRIDQGRVPTTIEILDTCNLTEEIVNSFKNLAKDKDVEVLYDCDKSHPQVQGDQNLFREVLINLIGNSLKFTKKGTITISHTSDDNALTIRVTDTGLGIEKKKQKMLFGRFQQAMSRTIEREAGGTGLGLYISREFMKIMGGSLELEKSEIGKGTTFKLTLPIVKEESVKNQ